MYERNIICAKVNNQRVCAWVVAGKEAVEISPEKKLKINVEIRSSQLSTNYIDRERE
jgi:hypothetical protein